MDQQQENEEVKSKVLIIADYLKEQFPTYALDQPPLDLKHIFNLHANGERAYSLTVWTTFLEDDDGSEDEFRARLQQENVAEKLRQNKEWHWK